jgi:hypothetical protein
MIILIMVMYPAKPGTSFSIVAKMFIYMFFGSLLVIFLHDGVLRYLIDDENQNLKAEAFMQNTTSGGREYDPSYGGLYKPVNPTPASGGSISLPVTVIVSAAEPAPVQVAGSKEVTSVVEGGMVTGGAPAKWKPLPAAKNPYK